MDDSGCAPGRRCPRRCANRGSQTHDCFSAQEQSANGSRRDRGGCARARSAGNSLDPGALRSLNESNRDLDRIRDANITLVQKDACPPEVAARLADLKAKLLGDESELNPGARPVAAAPGASLSESETPPARKRRGSVKIGSGARLSRHPAQAPPRKGTRRRPSCSTPLLPINENAAVPASGIDPKSPEAEQKRIAVEQDIARVKAEIEQLSGACAPPKP